MPPKAKPQPRPRPPPTPVPLLSPKIWMAKDFDPEEVSIPRMRAILDFNQVTDSYYRRWQQTALFQTKVLPRVRVLVDRYKGDISSIDDSILLKEILTVVVPKLESRKRRAPSESGDPATSDDNHRDGDGGPLEARAKATNKRLKSSN
ncbi:hypothetical protein PGTUg99_010985 [Puccinia graminis f. sp. tritici]|uniref:Uncharacterized protein n=1 Tax=Puccinia graminis f. sp. tritici TaxID=56615 RepID=A0A5B0N7I0_PUCGR|nr:hypothetical protein PGTUg99_010985 [Puccinia graminis f. sp. tritici]